MPANSGNGKLRGYNVEEIYAKKILSVTIKNFPPIM